MKKLLSTMTKVLGLTALLSSSTMAFAEEPTVITDGQQIELGKMYQLPRDYQTHSCYFVSENGGMLTINSTSALPVFSDAELKKELPQINGNYGGSLGYVYNFETEAGKNYYVSYMMCSGQKFIITEAANVELELIETDPADGSVLTTTPNAEVLFQFNAIPNHDATASVAAGENVQSVQPRYLGQRIDVDVTSALNAWYADGSLKAGDEITITVSNVTIEGSDAEAKSFSAKFKAAGVAAKKVSETVPAPFKSYWLKGAEEGIFTATFDQELGEGAKCEIYYGNKDVDGGYYVEQVPVTVEGKTLKVDFTGKRRVAEEMVTLDEYPSVMSWKIFNITDTNGQYVASNEQGAVGSFSYNAEYVSMKKADVAYEFTPANGGTLKGVDNLELYLRGGEALSFDGFTFTTKDGATNVALADCTVAEDAKDSSKTYTVAVPEAIKAGTEGVVVTLTNLQAIDGYDYNVEATYDTFVITYSDPAAGSVVEIMNEGDFVTIETNWAEKYPEMYIEGEIRDQTTTNPDKEYIFGLNFQRQDDGSYKAQVWTPTKFIKGHTYAVNCTAFETEYDSHAYAEGAKGAMATGSFTFEGGSAPFIPSDVKLVSVTPANWSSIPSYDEDFVITLTFDQMVNIAPKEAFINEGMGMESYFDKVENEDPYDDATTGKVFSNVWKYTLNAARISAFPDGLQVSFRATDMDGKLVVEQEGITAMEEPEETFYFQFYYSTPKQTVDFTTDPADDEEIESLSVITVDDPGYIMPSWNLPLEEITVMTMQGQVVAYVDEDKCSWSMTSETAYDLGLNTTVTEPGTYVIHFPEGVFSVGDNGDPSMEKDIRVFIGAATEPIEVKYHTDPEEGNVASLQEVTLFFDDLTSNIDFTWAGDALLYIDGVEAVNLSNEDCLEISSEDPDNWDLYLDRIIITLPEEYTAAGKYEIVFPAGCLYLDAENMISCDKEIRLTYTIGIDGIADIEAEGGVYRVYNISGMYLGEYSSAEQLNELPAGFYIVNGKKLYVK